MTLIDQIPRFTYRDLKPLIDYGFKQERPVGLTSPVKLGGLLYTISFNPKEWELLFQWEDEDGQKREKRVYLVGVTTEQYRGSYVWYFVCPYTGHKCRKLFADGRVIASRYAFRHTYSSRNKSHNQRAMEKLLNMPMDAVDFGLLYSLVTRGAGRPRKS